MNILVTGGCGFQGSHLVEALLKRGDFVRVLNTPSEHARSNAKLFEANPNVEIVWGSVLEQPLLEYCMDGIEKVFHLAAKIHVGESYNKSELHMKTNLVGTHNTLSAAHKADADVIHASSCEVYGSNVFSTLALLETLRKVDADMTFVGSASVYGKSYNIPKMNEYHPLNPQSPYAASKAASDRLCYAYHKSFGVKVKIVRPFNIFGPRQKAGGGGAVIPIFFDSALHDKTITIHGDGRQTRDYLYVDDIVKAYLLISELDELNGEVINVGSGVETEIGWLAETIRDIVGKGMIDHVKGRTGDVDSFICDNSKIEQYGFEPDISVEEGLKRYYGSV